jgi:hypothetical protein
MDDIQSKINYCRRRNEKLNEWEQEFIESVDDWYDRKGCLTDAQYEKLDDIYEKVVEYR